ncbi:MAG: hypothetical protein WAR83_08855 [Flavobacteriales bacterium]
MFGVLNSVFVEQVTALVLIALYANALLDGLHHEPSTDIDGCLND